VEHGARACHAGLNKVVAAIGLTGVRRLAFTVVLGQVAITLVAAAAAGALYGPRAGLSALLGGGVSAAGSLAMALLGFRGSALLLGEAAKFCVIVALFVLVLTLIKISAAAMFTTYAATFLVYWIVLASWLPRRVSEREMR
jgi:F0F1-type ATP synthase assembly protein I